MKAKTMIISMCVLVLGITSCKKKVDPIDTNPAYANVKITKVRIEQMPFVDANGAGWDNGDGPDVKFTLVQGSNSVVKSDVKKDVVAATLPLEWNLDQAYVISNFDTEYQLKVEDDDNLLDADDLIGAANFKANNYGDYPTTITLTTGNGVKAVLSVQWYN